MAPGCYTELFFLDEATALAAGHRPCGECRRERYNAFRQAWIGQCAPGTPLPTADEIDRQLHAERVTPEGLQRTQAANLDDLPDGVIVRHPDRETDAYLVWGDRLLEWSAGGYTDRIARPGGVKVEVLTPESTVSAIRAGYAPVVHPSAPAL